MDQHFEHIDDELEFLAPTLANLKKRNGFNIPNTYFENVGSEFKDNIHYSNSDDPTPSFDDQDTFKVPDGFFCRIQIQVKGCS